MDGSGRSTSGNPFGSDIANLVHDDCFSVIVGTPLTLFLDAGSPMLWKALPDSKRQPSTMTSPRKTRGACVPVVIVMLLLDDGMHCHSLLSFLVPLLALQFEIESLTLPITTFLD